MAEASPGKARDMKFFSDCLRKQVLSEEISGPLLKQMGQFDGSTYLSILYTYFRTLELSKFIV